MMIFSKSTVAAALLAAVSFAPLTASASLFDDDEARRAILDVRTRIDALQRDVNTRLDSKANTSSTLELANQNEQLRQEIAKLRGQVEVLTNDLANEQRRQKDFYVDLDGRLRKLEPQKITVDGKEANIGVFDLGTTNAPRPLTFGGANRYPIWANNERVAFQSEREGDIGIWWTRADGTGTAERLTSDQLARVRRAYAVPAAPGVTVAQASPRLLQPCPSPSSPNPPADPPRPGIDHHDGHSRLPRAWDDSEGFSATCSLASDTQATGVYSKYRCAGVQVRSRFRNLRGSAAGLSPG